MFVADAVPSELRRIIEFLNGQLTQTEVLAGNHAYGEGRSLRKASARENLRLDRCRGPSDGVEPSCERPGEASHVASPVRSISIARPWYAR